ncbi:MULTISPECIES: zinc metallopeptidase [unclassified Clostridium]|uniref:zinc metallopeptidase n=1 Tax=Clostridium TaxID=1485 RepID=UPI001C8B16BE|nr:MULTISPECIES: zinc metallopeptidase [unclassified Clostridium]MBX9135861.1 zinc metallopeptidase [Clostridium sp. K12(2020)]MBX9142591.1 zinc metallopeptidase [Clostridium sp. K13]MDU2288780.1 zinc metallopeptidase [Clostridium celatum]MDU4324387.1 zinc metallopeptidase [Clostridium celatum]
MFYPGFYFDRTMILLLPAIIIAFWAQSKVSSTYKKYRTVRTMNGYTGENVARMILDAAGLYDVPVLETRGELTDHYDPTSRVIRLSSDIYHGSSIAAAGIAAHEVGHAIQHKEAYKPLVLRTSIATAVNFSSQASIIIFMIGLLFSIPMLINIGIIFFTVAVIYQLITLPVEFNASKRALTILENRNILYGNEINGAKSVLSAAAMTYVAAALMSISQLIRLIAISNRNND